MDQIVGHHALAPVAIGETSMSEHWAVEPEPAEIEGRAFALLADYRSAQTAITNMVLPSDSPVVSYEEASDRRIERQVLVDTIGTRLRALSRTHDKIIEIAILAEKLHETTAHAEEGGTSFIELGMALEVTAERLAATLGKLKLSLRSQCLGGNQTQSPGDDRP